MKNYYKVSRFLIKHFSKLTIRHENAIFPICLKVHCHNFLQIKIIIKHHLERISSVYLNPGKMDIFFFNFWYFSFSPHMISFFSLIGVAIITSFWRIPRLGGTFWSWSISRREFFYEKHPQNKHFYSLIKEFNRCRHSNLYSFSRILSSKTKF